MGNGLLPNGHDNRLNGCGVPARPETRFLRSLRSRGFYVRASPALFLSHFAALCDLRQTTKVLHLLDEILLL